MRKNGPTKAPKRLVIRDGQIVMADGSDVRKYMKRWMKKLKIEDGEPVTIMTSRSAQELFDAYWIFQHWSA
jgi:hypothetical protein